jgi:predicted nucleotidyltransferase
LNLLGIPVEKAFLYGSYSRNEETTESDIDIMIVSPVFDECDDIIKAKALRLTKKINLKMEPYIVGSKKFLTDNVSPLLQIVKQEGIKIV